jgi:hypothetical protein
MCEIPFELRQSNQKSQQCRSKSIERKETLRKQPNQLGGCTEVVADTFSLFKNTMLADCIMIFG